MKNDNKKQISNDSSGIFMLSLVTLIIVKIQAKRNKCQ